MQHCVSRYDWHTDGKLNQAPPVLIAKKSKQPKSALRNVALTVTRRSKAKRNVLVDTMGNILKALRRAANLGGAGTMALLQNLPDTLWQRLELIWADGGYRGVFFEACATDTLNVSLNITLRSDGIADFGVIPDAGSLSVLLLAWLFSPLNKITNSTAKTARAGFMPLLSIAC